jgi:hypothetical protein
MHFMHPSIGQSELKPKRSIAVRCCNNCNNLTKYELHHVSITCRVHYRYDLDNSVMAIKFALGCVQTMGRCEGRLSPKYVDRIKMTYDPSLPKGHRRNNFRGLCCRVRFFFDYICGVKLKYQSDDTITFSRNLHPSGDGATSANTSTSKSRVMELEAKVEVLQRSIDTSLFI